MNSVHKTLTFLIAGVWLVNGLICKVLNFVPRHQAIVATILSEKNARLFIVLIGIAEIAMAVWILSGLWSRFNAITQIVLVAVMNTIEISICPDLLLWGKANAVFAALFIGIICYNEFYANERRVLQ